MISVAEDDLDFLLPARFRQTEESAAIHLAVTGFSPPGEQSPTIRGTDGTTATKSSIGEKS